MQEEIMSKCDNCGKEVSKRLLSRDGECASCKADDRSGDMCVGDLKRK